MIVFDSDLHIRFQFFGFPVLISRKNSLQCHSFVNFIPLYFDGKSLCIARNSFTKFTRGVLTENSKNAILIH